MTTSALTRRVFTGTVIQPDTPPVTPANSPYHEIASANDHLHNVIKALLKERSGQPLTSGEAELIKLHIAAQQWQLRHTNKD